MPCLPSRVPGYSESLGLQLSSAETQAAIKHLPSAGYSSAVCIHPGKAKNKNQNGWCQSKEKKKKCSVWKMYGEKFLVNTLAISM